MTHPLMLYLDSKRQGSLRPQQGVPQGGAGKYHGEVAQGYDAKRKDDAKWTVEQRVIESTLADLPAGSSILDVPVGTGRFIPFYLAHGFNFIGADISGDMLVQSALKILPEAKVEQWVAASNEKNTILPLRAKINRNGTPVEAMLVNGDVRNIEIPDQSVDAAVACRITRWLSPEDNQLMFRELQRAARDRVIITARVANHPHARTIELFQGALRTGWHLARNEAGYITDYRVLMFQKRA